MWIEDNLEGGKVVKKQSMGGSGWSSAAILTTENDQKYFAKESKGRGVEMFLGEAKGLQAMHGTPSHVAPLFQNQIIAGSQSLYCIVTRCRSSDLCLHVKPC
jgi:fructosamine-3-kinase